MHTLDAVILAAGKSSRFNTGTSKQLTPLCGQAMVLYPVAAARALGCKVTVVVGNAAAQVIETVTAFDRSVKTALQSEQKGTGHAVQCAQHCLTHNHVLVLNGDMPLLTEQILQEVVQEHMHRKNLVTVSTTVLDDPTGYGRIVHNADGVRIIEEKECDEEQKKISTVNAGIYVVQRSFLVKSLAQLTASAQTGEIYLTDIVGLARERGGTCAVAARRVHGVNTLAECAAAEKLLQRDICDAWMARGVRFRDPGSCAVDHGVMIGAGAVIERGVHLRGATMVGKRVHIDAYSVLDSALIDDDAQVKSHSVIEKSRVEPFAVVGPFARLRGEAHIARKAVIGNFVEVKKSFVGAESKAKHLTYLGDTMIGTKSNIGGGTITCNYDGKHKHQTVIGDNVMVGANSSLVAPVTLEDDAYVGAGSTITRTVPSGALGIGRARQAIKEGWHKRLQLRQHKKKEVQV